MNEQTANIVRAAKYYRAWGRINTTAFCLKRGIDLRLVRLARQLQAAGPATS